LSLERVITDVQLSVTSAMCGVGYLLLICTGFVGIGEVCETDTDCTVKGSFCDKGICACHDRTLATAGGTSCRGR